MPRPADTGPGKRFLAVIGLWGIGVAMVLLALAPSWPRSAAGWVALVVFGPPVAFAVEWIGERVFSTEIGRRISGAPFSIARILVALAVLLVGIALLALGALALDPWLRRVAG